MAEANITDRLVVQQALLVGTRYDRYLLEQAGMIGLPPLNAPSPERQQWRNPPRLRLCQSQQEATELVASGEPIDLVITDHGIRGLDGFAVGRALREIRPELPLVLLSSDPRMGGPLSQGVDLEAVDHVFVWSGNLALIRRIVQLLEDERNAAQVIGERGCRWLLLVEDEASYYSRYICIIYNLVEACMRDVIAVAPEAAIRETRPRLLLAKDFEQAGALMVQYEDRLIGVISDLCFPVGGALDPEAGLALLEAVKASPWDLPVVIQSMERGVRQQVHGRGATFLAKDAPDLLTAMRKQLTRYFGFGDFIFRMPGGQEVARAKNLDELRDCVSWVPLPSLIYHARRRHFSNWLAIHGRFRQAEAIRPLDGPDHALRKIALEGLKADPAGGALR